MVKNIQIEHRKNHSDKYGTEVLKYIECHLRVLMGFRVKVGTSGQTVQPTTHDRESRGNLIAAIEV